MPPAGTKKGTKRARQYEHVKASLERRGSSRAEEIAARTVNKQRAQAGETKRGRASAKTRDELYRQAQRLGIRGRSKMSKAQLVEALARRS